MGVRKNSKQILADNLKALMERQTDLNSQAKIAAKASKIGGSKVAQTTISNMLDGYGTHWPSLKTIEAVAAAFNLQAWQLLHPTIGDETEASQIAARLRDVPSKDRNIVYQILDMEPASNSRVARHIPPLRPKPTKSD